MPAAPGLAHRQSESLTVAQRRYFEDSLAIDEAGNLKRVYHGSAHEFSAFEPSMLGRGNDQWGTGFYFSDQEHVSRGYANDTKSPDANVKEFYLNLTNPIYVDGNAVMSLNDVEFATGQSLEMLLRHPHIFLQPNEESDDGSVNPMGDYLPEFWDKDHHSRAEMEAMVRKMARDYFDNENFVEMEVLYGRDLGAQFVEVVRDVTGHDGVIVDFGEDGKHYVAWFANQMKLTSNESPDGSNAF